MERMSYSTSGRCSTSCQHYSSCQQRRSRSLGCQEDPQAERMDVNFHQQLPQVTPHQRSTVQGSTQSPSPTRQKHWVTFAEGRAPSLTEESPEHDALVDEAHQLPPPMWQTEEAPPNEANWIRSGGVEGDEDLECSLPLEPHLQELFSREKPSLAGTKVGDCLSTLLMSMPKGPEPSPLHQLDWILWHARHVPMLPW